MAKPGFDNKTKMEPNKLSGFSCDACEKEILENETVWHLKVDAPVSFNFNENVLLCATCHSDFLVPHEATLCRNSSSFRELACMTSECPVHAFSKEWRDTKASCLCQCAICNKAGWAGCEKEWFTGLSRVAHGDGVRFLLCPGCVPSIVREGINQNDKVDKTLSWKLSGEFSRKWFDPHLQETVMDDNF